MLRIVMDTTGDLGEDWQEKYDINLIPINIIHHGTSYRQGIDINYDDFYRIIEEEGIIPTTSQPTPYQFVEFYKKIAKPGDDILSIHITEKLSGTMASARQAAEMLKDEYNIHPFDSASGAACMGMMCKEARLMERAGGSLASIWDKLSMIRQKMVFLFTLDTVKFARLSGRINSFEAILASVLDIKPILEVQNGFIETIDKVRIRKSSLARLIRYMQGKMGEQPLHMAVAHAHDLAAGELILEQVKKMFNCVDIVFTEVSISLATHFGPGAIGLAAYPA